MDIREHEWNLLVGCAILAGAISRSPEDTKSDDESVNILLAIFSNQILEIDKRWLAQQADQEPEV